MADATKIEWTDATWNPITGCNVVSPGCTNCYAMKLAGTRLQHHPSRAGLTRETKAGPVWNGTVRFNEEWLTQPLLWKRPRMIFVCAHGDLGHPDIPTKWLDRVFAVMMLARRHTYQVLTKRPERLREYLTDPSTPGRIARMAVSIMADGIFVAPLDAAQITYAPDPGWQFGQKPVGLAQWPLPNVWLGTSVEDQERADQRVPELLATPAAVHFVSAEPLLGPIDFSRLKLTAADSAGNPINIIDPLDAFTGMTWTTLRSGAHAGKRFYSGSTGGRGTLDWIIVGGESGQGARPMHPDWPRHIRDQCAAAGTAFFFKQWGEWSPAAIERRGTGLHDNEVRLHADGRQNGDGGIRTGGITLRRAGKKAAGRLLDGVEHNAIPRAA